jgi:hypothetical protein
VLPWAGFKISSKGDVIAIRAELAAGINPNLRNRFG